MVPYHRFLLAVMALPVSRENRVEMLETTHCYGTQRQTANAFAIDLANNLEQDYPNYATYLRYSADGQDATYHKEEAEAFAFSFGTFDMVKHFLSSSSEESPVKTALELATRRQAINILLPLLATEYPGNKIISAYKKRFGKELSQETLEAFYFYFANFGTLTERQIHRWIETTPPRLRYLLRVALSEPIHFLLDELGLDADIDANYAASRILTRSLTHFERLSSSRHHKALKEARKWADLAIKAGDRKEKYENKDGDMNSFLDEFKISLLEMSETVFPHEADFSEDE